MNRKLIFSVFVFVVVLFSSGVVLAQTTFAELGVSDTGGAGFKVVSTNPNLVVSNVMVNDGTAMYTSTHSSFIIKAYGVDDFTFEGMTLKGYASTVADLSSTVVFKDKNGHVIQTMTLNSDKTLTTSNISLTSFFDNGTTTPIYNVAQIVFDLKTPVQNYTMNFTYVDITISATSLNNAPTAASFTAGTIYEDTAYAFATANFGYSDGDSDPIDHVRVTAIPSNGTLWIDSDGSGTINGAESPLTNGAAISKANLDAGYLKYINTNGTSSTFTFDVNDGTDYSASTYTATLTVTPLGEVTSVAVPANGTYIAGQNLDFTINFDENITVVTTGGTPQLSITIGSTTRQATYTTGSGTGALLFRYTIQAGELDTNGIEVNTLTANGGTLRNAASNDAKLTLNSVGSAASVLVDAVAPTLDSSVPADEATGVSVSADITLTFSENIAFGTGNILIKDLDDVSNITIDAASPGTQASILNNVLTLNPSSDLVESHHYAIQIAATAIDDIYGNSYSGITDDITFNFQVQKANQTISFGALPIKIYGDVDFTPEATATSGLTVTYSSSNTAVATIVSGQIHIVSAGSCTIYADQAGNETYDSAPQESQLLTVNKAVSVITWGNPSDITYGTALSGNELNAEANVTGSFEYTPAINTVLGSGHSQSLSVTFTPDDTTNYTTETKTVSINVSPAELTAKADDKTRNYGEANPAFTITYSGFVNGEYETAVTTASTAVTTATANSPAGTYDITVSGGTAPNYTFTYTKGTLTINGIIPTATTGTASTLTTRQATLNGTVADNGGNTVTEKGICISTSANPTTADTCMTDTSEESVIIGTFTGLNPNTTYHYRAYATTLEGTGYGNDQTFITYKAIAVTTGQSFNINENSAALTAVGTIEITGDIQGTANYTITTGDTENIFQMSGAEIQVADATKLDYETAVSHTVTIKIEDDENTSEETVTINLTNLNDNTPVITDSQYTLSENALNGTVIATLSAADADGTLNELTYTIETGNNDGIFALNAATGELTVIDNTNLDYETTASYSLGIKVSDTENEASATVTVTITDDTGTCAEPTEIDTLPFTVDTTTAERYSNITNYGANCGETTYGENDHTYVYTVSTGDKIEITATPETNYDLILMIQSDCGNNCDTYANEGTAGTAETIIYEATENKDIYIIVEGINGSGTYTLDVKVKVEETPDEDELTDDDEIIDEETDEDIYPVDEDEITDDDATSTDEDEVIDEETDEDIYPVDEDEITDDDATSTDEDEVIDEETDEDIYPADEDEVTDTETDNDVTEVIDEENDEESDTEETDLDIVKPSSDDGCGCSVISW